MRVLVLVIAGIAVSGCAGYLLGDRTPAAAKTAETGDRRTVRDSAISGEIRQRFNTDDALSGQGLGIRTVDGRVTLSGSVASYAARDRAVELASSTPGVREVDNRIVVNTSL